MEIYVFNQFEQVDLTVIKRARQVLSRQRLDKVDRFRFVKDQNISLLSYILFLYAYARRTGERLSKPVFTLGQYGKPIYRNRHSLQFNLSHCDQAIGCALSENPVGIDVQDITGRDLSILPAFSKAEQMTIENARDSERQLIKLWTYKESYLKFVGTGLINRLYNVDYALTTSADSTTQTFYFKTYDQCRYIVTVCGMDRVFDYREVTWHDIMNYLHEDVNYCNCLDITIRSEVRKEV